MTTLTKLMVRASLCLAILTLSGASTVGELESINWIPYTTVSHAEMADNSGFSDRLHRYLSEVRKLTGEQLKKEFSRWYSTNLGHVFEEASLASYGILKNHHMFNGRIPDGVENGILEQIVQYTNYPASTFIEVKYKAILSIEDPQIRQQLIDMIDFLSANEMHKTVSRFGSNNLTRIPRKASQEGLAILLFLTPENTIIAEDLLSYARHKRVKVYQMKMFCNFENQEMLVLSKPSPLTGVSLHFHGHLVDPFMIKVNWRRNLIDPDTGREIDY